VDGSLAPSSAVTVDSGATLGGTGTAAGAVAIADGGILAPGDTVGTLTMGSLSLSNASLLNYELGAPGVIGSGVNDLTIVTGNLTLDGILNTTALPGFGPGGYRLFNYGGALTDNALDIGTVPAGFVASNFMIVTGVPNEVDLLVLAGTGAPAVQFWDGPNIVANGVIDGGTGNWDNFTTNWTDAAGAANSSWLNGMAVFAGNFGTVTVTDSIFFTGLEFMTDGYHIDAGVEGSLNLIGSPTITTDLDVTATISAPLYGDGGITKEGAGTLVLSGTNTYFGITTIDAGILSISRDANLGTAPGSAVADQLTFDGGTLQATAGFTLNANRGITLLAGGGTIGVTEDNLLSYGGVITGSGAFTKTDTGTLELSGINTYTGATAMNDGTLMAGVANTLPSQTALSVLAGATFDLNSFDQSIGSLAGAGSVTLGTATLTTGNNNTSTDFSGIISGLGALTKVGTGTQTLSGANTYTGATAVNDGTLMAGVANTLPSQTALSVLAGAIFDLNSFDQSIGSLAGAGSVTLGTATLTTGNDNTSTDFSGIISGLGALTKVGTGTQTLSGANTYAGTTAVNGGSLFVDGSVASAQTLVNPGGLLGGQGFLGGNLVNSGIVSPGHSPGTLTVGLKYTQTAGGTLRIEVAGLGANEHDLLMVNSTATLAGTLQVIRLNNFQFHVGDQITFLTANGGVKGTFDPIENDFFTTGTLVESQIVYLPNSVVLQETQGSFADFASTFCADPNHVAVGAALDKAVGDSRAAGLIDFLNSEPMTALCRDLELISPEEVAAIFNIGVSLANVQTANLERRMDDIRAGSNGFSAAGFAINDTTPGWSGGLAGATGPEGKAGESVMQPTPDNRWGFFVTGLGEFTNVGDTSNAPGYDLTTGGLTFGIDYRVSSNFAIGLTGGYAHTRAEIADNGNIEVDGGKIGFYATAFSGGFYVDTAATGGISGYDTRRTALLGEAHGSTNGGDFAALISAGYDWKSGGLSIGPIASFQYTYTGFDGFTESGSLAPLIFNDQHAESTRSAFGLKTSYDWKMGGVLVKPELRAAWQHEYGDSDYSLVSRFANGAGNNFTVHSPAIGRDSVLIGAGVAVHWNDWISTYTYYDGELGRTNYVSHNISAGVRVNF
jgi:outer membrane autotransporter protein